MLRIHKQPLTGSRELLVIGLMCLSVPAAAQLAPPPPDLIPPPGEVLPPDPVPPPCDPPPPEQQVPPGTSYTAAGMVTERCGEDAGVEGPVRGHPVEVMARMELFNPCAAPPFSYTKERSMGTATTAEDGRFSLVIDGGRIRSEIPADEVLVDLQMRARLLYPESGNFITESGYASETAPGSGQFALDVTADFCLSQTTRIYVHDEQQGAVAGAEVYVNGRRRGMTNEEGFLDVEPRLRTGDELAARLMIHENPTPRGFHNFGSTQNWNYRVYITSVPIQHDAQGDNVIAALHVVPPPPLVAAQLGLPDLPIFPFGTVAEQTLRLDRRNALVGFNLRVAIEWHAGEGDYAIYVGRLIDSSEFLYNATDGQFLIEQAVLEDDGRHWEHADVRIMASINQPSQAHVGAIRGATGRITMNPVDAKGIGTLVHELGHYAFYLGDEYKAGADDSQWDDAFGNPHCTVLSHTTSGPFEDGGPKNSCIMRFAAYFAATKICSGHPDNPHSLGTAQGDTDCWTEILNRYSDDEVQPPRWILHSPVTRGAIVGALPELGDLPGRRSFVPVSSWKTTVIQSRRSTPPVCGDHMIATFRIGTQPINGAEVYLETSEGRTIFQGRTRERPVDGIRLEPGQLPVKGVHVGDRIRIIYAPDSTPSGQAGQVFTAEREVTEQDCLSGEILLVSPVELVALTELQFALRGGTASTPVDPSASAVAFSVDGHLELNLAAGALPGAAEIMIELDPDLPLPDVPGHVLLGPYTISTSDGSELAAPAMLHFAFSQEDPALEILEAPAGRLQVLGHDPETQTWMPFISDVNAEAAIVSASVGQLGTYVLVDLEPALQEQELELLEELDAGPEASCGSLPACGPGSAALLALAFPIWMAARRRFNRPVGGP